MRRALLALWATLAPLDAPAAQAPPARPNVVLCMADDQGWGDVGYNGHPHLQTPVLDEMARSGLRFDRFYAAAPVCSPTRGSVLTGRHPNRFGCFAWGYPLRAAEVTLAERLRDAGYATGHFGKWHLGSVRKGAPTSPGAHGFESWVSSPNFYDNSPSFSDCGRVVQTDGESSRVTVDAALDFIGAAVAAERRFLAVVWFGSPHTPHRAAPELAAHYDGHPADAQQYYGEITGIDRAVGQLRRGLRGLGVADDTLLWYCSDNGSRPPGSTGGLRGAKRSLWEGGVRVPAVLEWPRGLRTPRTTAEPAGTVDILPTVLELCGVEPPAAPLDGVSLAPLLGGGAAARPRPLGFWFHPAPGRAVHSAPLLAALAAGTPAATGAAAVPIDPALPGRAAWLDGRFKLHRFPGDAGAAARYELYDLQADPAERDDLAPAAPARVAAMATALAAWQRDVVASCRATAPPVAAAAGDWPAFRGPAGDGIATSARAPLRWGPDENIAWKVPLPRPANGSPIVSNGRVFVGGAEDDDGKRRTLSCFDRSDGALLWTRTVAIDAVLPTHETNPYGGSTPAADGTRVVVWHGTAGLHCYGFDGAPLWQRDLGEFRHRWGYGTSPVVDQGVVYLHTGPGARVSVLAIRIADGEVLWRVEEPVAGDGQDNAEGRLMGSWCTPLLWRRGDRPQLICTHATRVVGYDLRDGTRLWWCRGVAASRGDLAYSSPVVIGEVCLVRTGYEGATFGVRLGGAGDVTDERRLWRRAPRPSNVGSGVGMGGLFYTPDLRGMLACVDPATGDRIWTARAGRGACWSSVVVAGQHAYLTNQRGTTLVFRPSRDGLVEVARNALGERTNATPAIAGGEIFLRTHGHLYLRVGAARLTSVAGPTGRSHGAVGDGGRALGGDDGAGRAAAERAPRRSPNSFWSIRLAERGRLTWNTLEARRPFALECATPCAQEDCHPATPP